MEASVVHKRRVVTTSAGTLAIAQRVTALRKARGLTQVELARRLGVFQALVSKYENGEVLLHAELLAELAMLFNISADELLGLQRRRSKRLVAPLTPAVDKGLARRFAQLQSLPRRDRETVSRTIDALVAARGVGAGHAA
jgi:transcriptional regulator with XRE-family HTH domain